MSEKRFSMPASLVHQWQRRWHGHTDPIAYGTQLVERSDIVPYVMSRTMLREAIQAEMDFMHPYWSIQEPPLAILLRGAPGSGKSTWAAYFLAHWPHEAAVASATDYFRDATGKVCFQLDELNKSHAWCQDVLRTLCNLHVPRIIVDNTHIKHSHYATYCGIARNVGYRVFQHCCLGTFPNTSGVPEEQVKRMRREFEHDKVLPHYSTSGTPLTLEDLGA